MRLSLIRDVRFPTLADESSSNLQYTKDAFEPPGDRAGSALQARRTTDALLWIAGALTKCVAAFEGLAIPLAERNASLVGAVDEFADHLVR